MKKKKKKSEEEEEEVGLDREKMCEETVGGKTTNGKHMVETSSKRPRYDAMEPETISSSKKKRKKDKSKRHVVNFKDMDAESQRLYLSKVLVDSGVMAEIEMDGVLTRERFYDLQNVSRSLKKICGLVRSILSLPRPSNSEAEKGAPRVLILCAGAKRATDLIKGLRPLRIRLGKLFAKHIKLSEQCELLRETEIPVAVGTPNRVGKLISSGALSLSQVSVILIDTFRNQKQMSVLDIRDTKKDLLALLKNHVIETMKTSKAMRIGLM